MIAGVYDNSRRMESSFFSLLSLAGPIKVVANEDGTISVPMATNLAGVPVKWREVEPFVWRDVDGKNLLSAEVRGRTRRALQLRRGLAVHGVRADAGVTYRRAGCCRRFVAGLIALLLTSARVAGLRAGAPALRRAVSARGPGCEGASLGAHRCDRRRRDVHRLGRDGRR